MSDEDDTRDAIGDALADVMDRSGEMVTRWLVVMETIDGTGERGLWTAATADLRSWDVLGMLDVATERERRAATLDDQP